MNKAAIVFALSLISGAAFSGAKYNNEVTYFGNSFQGSFGSIRNSADTRQYLYCQRRTNAATCWARHVSDGARICSTTDPGHLAMLDSLTSSSNLYVTYDDDGNCEIMLHRVGSVNEPLM